MFGSQVSALVAEVTDDKTLDKHPDWTGGRSIGLEMVFTFLGSIGPSTALHAQAWRTTASRTVVSAISLMLAKAIFSTAMAALLRAPFGRPCGLPRLPAVKMPSGFRPVLTGAPPGG
jgi:hypothetical protein